MSNTISLKETAQNKSVSPILDRVNVKSNGIVATYTFRNEKGESESNFEIAVISEKRAKRLGQLRKTIIENSIL